MEIITKWVVHSCLRCRALYAIPQKVDNRLRESHTTFYCPYCQCSHHFAEKTYEEKLQEEKDQLTQKVRWCENRLVEKDHQIKKVDGRARAYKGLYKREKRST